MPKLFKWTTMIYEGFLSIPIIGGIFILSNSWVPLLFALVLHAIAWWMSNKHNIPKLGNLFGIIASIFGIIPILGWILHVMTFIMLVIDIVFMYGRNKA